MGILQGEIDYFDAMGSLDQMPKQRDFIFADQSHAAYVGGQGAGKSVALMATVITEGVEDPNGFSLVGRLNMPALESTTLRTFLEMVPPEWGEWAEAKKTFTFSNGHPVIFRHLDISDPKVSAWVRSLNLSGAYVDEGTEVSEDVYRLLIGRLRRKKARRRIFRLASNPNGHDWVWRNFFDPNRKEALLKTNFGITASTMANPFLPPEYVENMLNTYPEDWQQRFIYGSFSDFSDLVYKEFSEPTHVWDATKTHAIFEGKNKPPREWPVIVGIDIGSDIDPWACTIDAVSPSGMLFQDGEVYGSSLLIKTIADELREKIDGREIAGIAYDYENRQVGLELAEHDICAQAALKEVRPGLFKVAQYMHIDPRLQHPFNPNVQGSPRAFVSSECINTIRETSDYKWGKDKSGNPTGEPAHKNSHSPDARRYAIHTFRPVPGEIPLPKKWENPHLNIMSREYWRIADLVPDKRDRMEQFIPRGSERKTIQEWQREAMRGPIRFIRPSYAKFLRPTR